MFERGSEWRKWDLHIHSPLSILNNQFPTLESGEPDWEAYITRLEGLNLDALAVTDYFTIEGYKKILEFRKQGRLQGVSLILPNIEFRLDVFVGKEAKRANFHVIFSDLVSVQDIEEHFLTELKFVFEKDPFNTGTSKSLKKANLEALGAKLKSEQPDLPGTSHLAIGASQAAINLDSIVDCLKRQPDRFGGRYLLLLADEGMSKLSWSGQDHAARKNLLQTCQMVFVSNSKAIEFLLGKPPTYPDGPEKFVGEFGSLKPAVWGSDAHSLIELGNPCAKRGEKDHSCSLDLAQCDPRYTWVKADPTFEGLKQLLCEPEDRVSIGSAPRSEPKSTFTLSEFSIQGATLSSGLTIANTTIPLNSGLVVITGGKGSGKTAFADLLANCFIARVGSSDANSFLRRIEQSKPEFTTSFKTIGGTEFSKRVLDKTVFDKSEVVYIPQGELDSTISEKSDFSKYIHSLVFENERVRNTKQVFEFNELETTARRLKSDISKSIKRAFDLDKETRPEILEQNARDIELSSATIHDLSQRIEQMGQTEGSGLEEILKANEESNRKIDELSAARAELEDLRSVLLEIAEFSRDQVPRINAMINRVNGISTKQLLEGQLTLASGPDVAAIGDLETKAKTALEDVFAKIETEQKKLSGHTSVRQQHAQLLASKSDATKKLAQLQNTKIALEAKCQEQTKLMQSAHDSYRKLLVCKVQTRALYEKIIQTFQEKRETILKDLSFQVQVKFDRSVFDARAEELFDNRALLVRGDADRKGALEPLCDALTGVVTFQGPVDGTEFFTSLDNVDKLIDEAEALVPKLKVSFQNDPGKLYELLLGDHFSVEPSVAYKGVEVSKLSLGQKATVLVKIHLAQGDRPIIIDSHDDHLDNEFIMEELIDALRNAKRYRQIILASNNGNVVVNSDADQLILSRIEGQTISYSSGSLENPAVRTRALTVLEGGEVAFRRRQDKYRLGRIQ